MTNGEREWVTKLKEILLMADHRNNIVSSRDFELNDE
jgi:hypothetical protein